MPAKVTARCRATGVCPINPSVIPDATFAPSPLTHSEEAQVCNVVTATEKPTAVLLSQQKTRKAPSLTGTFGNVVPTNKNDDTLAYGTEECHYITERSTESKIFNVKQTPTADDKKSDTVLLS